MVELPTASRRTDKCVSESFRLETGSAGKGGGGDSKYEGGGESNKRGTPTRPRKDDVNASSTPTHMRKITEVKPRKIYDGGKAA